MSTPNESEPPRPDGQPSSTEQFTRRARAASQKTRSATASLLESVNARSQFTSHHKVWGLVALPVLALISLVAVFMPVVTRSFFGLDGAEGYVNSSEAEFAIVGIVLILSFLSVGILAVLALFSGRRTLAISAGTTAVLVGLLATVLTLILLLAIAQLSWASAGLGLLMHLVLAPLTVVAGIITLRTVSKGRGAAPEVNPHG